MVRSIVLVLILVATPALAEPHAYFVEDRSQLPSAPDQPRRGTFNRISPPRPDVGRLHYYQSIQILEAQRLHELRAAELVAPRVHIDVHVGRRGR